MRLRDELGVIYEDDSFRPLFATRGRLAEAPWRLTLVCVMQFAEQLSDRQAADAVRARIDWNFLPSYRLLTQLRPVADRSRSVRPAAFFRNRAMRWRSCGNTCRDASTGISRQRMPEPPRPPPPRPAAEDHPRTVRVADRDAVSLYSR
jgi:hypothetical protein